MRYAISILLCLFSMCSFSQTNDYYLFVGTATTEISVYKFNLTKGEASFVSKVSGVENPTYMAFSKHANYVYAVNENSKEKKGEVSAFSFDKIKGELHFINRTSSGGDGPCFVDIDSSGKWVVVANYAGGNLSALKTNADGSLQAPVQTIDHTGYSVNFTRQSKPHVHCAFFSPNEKYVIANDLGTDKIYQYQFNGNNDQQPLSEEAITTDVPDGSGPRHLSFHPNNKFAYLINELSGKVIAYAYHEGKLTEIQTIQSCTVGDKNDMGSADIHLTPNGQYLYASNRGTANDITIYRVGSTGLLTEVGHQSSLGIHPRNFTIDPSGKFLLVANRDTNNIVVFNIIKSTGYLQPTGVQIQVDKPMFVKLIPVH